MFKFLNTINYLISIIHEYQRAFVNKLLYDNLIINEINQTNAQCITGVITGAKPSKICSIKIAPDLWMT